MKPLHMFVYVNIFLFLPIQSAISFNNPNDGNTILEERVVTNTNDTGPGSLREAIYEANNLLHINRNIIRFKIPKTDPGYDAVKGIWIIQPDSAYEYIIDNGLTIDGFSQSAFIGEDTNPNGPEIVIDGINAGKNAYCFTTRAEGTEIYGLTINNFGSVAIIFYSPGFGKVSGCYIGTDYSGMKAAGNKFGIALWYKVSGVHIGPTEYAYPNIISGNTQSGIFLADSAQHNIIVGNYIGLNRDKTALVGNYLRGIDLERSSDYNEIFDNYIGGNMDGITIIRSNNNVIANNFIGTNESMESDFGNGSGVFLWSRSSDNLIVQNIIGHNTVSGVVIDSLSCQGNIISRNSISQNNGLGIDNRNGANSDLATPILLSVTASEIKGTAGANQIIEIFADTNEEGQVFIDSTVTDSQGNFTLSISGLPELPYITATARDSLGNTSEFSTPFTTTNIENHLVIRKFYLYQNYPNPFNPHTRIAYELPITNDVELSIYNALGQKVVTLVNERKPAGKYEVEWDAHQFSSGIYLVKLITDKGFSDSKKMILIK